MGAGPSEGFLSSYFRNPFKKREKGDIELENKSGKRDPRLPKESTFESIKSGFKKFRSLGSKDK